jgi:hypothetical protein
MAAQPFSAGPTQRFVMTRAAGFDSAERATICHVERSRDISKRLLLRRVISGEAIF